MYLLDSGLRIENGQFMYAWYSIDQDGSRFFRVAALKELYILTDSPTQKMVEGYLGKTWALVRGLYNARVNFLYSAAGIFTPESVGIVQLYGAAANGLTEQEAAEHALADVASVQATMAGSFGQSRMRTPNLDVMRWYVDFIAHSKNVVAILGHPDPRTKRQSMGRDGGVPEEADELAVEQNEVLFRGLAANRMNFVFQVNSKYIPRQELTQTLVNVSQIGSNLASRQKGTKSIGFSIGLPIFNALGHSYTGGAGSGQTHTDSIADGASRAWGNSNTLSKAHTDSISHSDGISVTDGVSGTHSTSMTTSTGQANTVGQADSVMHSVTVSDGASSSASSSWGWNAGASGAPAGVGITGGFGHSWSAGSTSSKGVAVTDGTSHTDSQSHTDSSGQANGTVTGSGWMHAQTETSTTTTGKADTVSVANGVSDGWGKSHAEGVANGESQSQSGGDGLNAGITYGISPSISLNQSWATEDDLAIRLTEVVRGLESLANAASAEGGFATNAFIFTDNKTASVAAEALVPDAFHGPSVPTPVMTIVPDEIDILDVSNHAQAFLPILTSSSIENDPFENSMFWKYATMLPSSKVAAYASPAIIQEGTLKIIAQLPDGIGFYPHMIGNVVIGHQYSPTTGELTNAQVKMDMKRLMHWLIAGNTGFGKSVVAQRAVYEYALRYGLSVVVLDFGFAWRSLLNAPGLEGRVDIRQLRPDGVRPLRWNPFQVGTYINPETQLKAFADIFGSIAQLGQKQQQHRLLDAARTVYIRGGVLVDDPDVRKDPEWNQVRAVEALATGLPVGALLSSLEPDDRQKLAVLRSKKVGLEHLFAEVEQQFEATNPRDQVARGVLDGILWRLRSLVKGGAAAMFAAGDDSQAVEDLARPDVPGQPGKVVILEGGKFLDNFAKAFILGWSGWMIYANMVARRERQINMGEADMVMVYEEANIIFTGMEGGDPEQKSGPSVSEQQSNMFRDSRKYGIFFFVITQSPYLIPPGIVTSCNNISVGYLTNPKDKDVVLAALAKSEKGFTDEPWRRFISDQHIGMLTGRFPYDDHRENMLPILYHPLILNVPEPSDAEIQAKLGRIKL